MSDYKINFMKMIPGTRQTNRRTDLISGEEFYELSRDIYSLAFFAFYIDDDERDEEFILNELEEELDKSELQSETSKSKNRDTYGTSSNRISINFLKNRLEDLNYPREENNFSDIIEHLKVKRYLRRMERGRMLQKVLLTYLLQIFIIIILYNYFSWMIFSPPQSFNLCALAFLCCVVLHLYLQPTVFTSLERMRYLFAHKDQFEQTFWPFTICFMKFSCELLVEGIEVLTTYLLSYDELWVIMCYSAFIIICQIDNQYFEIIDNELKDKFTGKYKMCLKIENEKELKSTKARNLLTNKYSLTEKLYYSLLIFLEFVYETIYFYFMPYLAIMYATFFLVRPNIDQ